MAQENHVRSIKMRKLDHLHKINFLSWRGRLTVMLLLIISVHIRTYGCNLVPNLFLPNSFSRLHWFWGRFCWVIRMRLSKNCITMVELEKVTRRTWSKCSLLSLLSQVIYKVKINYAKQLTELIRPNVKLKTPSAFMLNHSVPRSYTSAVFRKHLSEFAFDLKQLRIPLIWKIYKNDSINCISTKYAGSNYRLPYLRCGSGRFKT